MILRSTAMKTQHHDRRTGMVDKLKQGDQAEEVVEQAARADKPIHF